MHIHEQLQLLTGQEQPVLGYSDAHPDDLLMHGLSAHEARQTGLIAHELVLTLGEAGINHRTNEAGFVKQGKRYHEGRATAGQFELNTYTQYNFGDGELLGKLTDEEQSRRMLSATTDWIMRHEVSVLFVTNIADHADHDVATEIGLQAAINLADQGHDIAVAALLPKQRRQEADFSVPATPLAVRTVIGAAALNRSQFQIEQNVHDDDGNYTQAINWPIVGGYHIETGTLARLTQYPIRQDAPYALHTAEQLRARQVSSYAAILTA